MRQFTFYTFSLLLCTALILTSCSKEEPLVASTNYATAFDTAEAFLATYNVPQIMFSYNVLDTRTKSLTSILIDDEGKVRKYTNETSVVDHQTFIPSNNLNLMKQQSVVVPDTEVDIEDMVKFFKQLRTSEKMEYDSSVETEESEVLTAVYGYYFYIQEGSDSHEDCERNSSSLNMYRPILLEQSLDLDLIQLNPTTRAMATWVKDASMPHITAEDTNPESN